MMYIDPLERGTLCLGPGSELSPSLYDKYMKAKLPLTFTVVIALNAHTPCPIINMLKIIIT